MAKIKKLKPSDLSALTSSAIVVQKVRGQLVVSKPTIPRESKSAKKLEANERFAEGNSYAKHILEQPGMKELYARGINHKNASAHTIALRDYLNAPEIHYINVARYTGEPGSLISIKATDDFEVTAVDVSIHSADGKLLEKGAAEHSKRKASMWYYRSTVTNPEVKGTIVKVSAFDRPENETHGEIVCEG